MPDNMTHSNISNIFNIPANYNFCDTLHSFVKQNYENNIELTILLSSKRACRELKKVFAKNGEALIMPRIKSIADINYEDFIFLFKGSNQSEFQEELEKVIDEIFSYKVLSGIDELFYLAQEVKKVKFFGATSNLNQSLKIANNLCQLFLEIEKNGLELQDFDAVDDSNLSQHRQVTFEFLKNFYFQIKNSLIKERVIFESSFVNLKLSKFIKFLDEKKLQKPLIIAGSTASTNIGKGLIKAAIGDNKSRIILSGFTAKKTDQESHPQFFLNRLIDSLKYDFSTITNLKYNKFLLSPESRIDAIRNIFLPANEMGSLKDCIIDDSFNDMSQNISTLEAKDRFLEASMIAKIVGVELQKKQRIAIISADSQISDLIKSELELINIKYNDSSDINITKNPLINFLLMIVDFCCSDFNSHSFLSIVKHDLCRYSLQKDLLEKFELEILRQNRLDDGIKGIKSQLEKCDDDNLRVFFDKFYDDLNIFLECSGRPLGSQIYSLILAVEKLTQKSWLELLRLQECSLEIFEFIESLKKRSDFIDDFSDLALILKNLSSHISYFKKNDISDNSELLVQIISPIEARLLNFDLVIIPALNDGIFPKNNPENWLGRKIKKDLNIDNTLKQIGQNAHDFCHYLASKKVILSRHLSDDDNISSASPFWLRFDLFCQKFDIKIKSHHFVQSNKLQDHNEIYSQDSKPEKEIINFDFKNISITDCVRLVKEPYFVFAKKILGLRELNNIDYRPSFAEFGSFVHESLENYIAKYSDLQIDDFLREAKIIYQNYFLREEDELLWWSKFPIILHNFIKDNESFMGCNNMLEVPVEMELSGHKIIGKIDRITFDQDNGVQIIDYKTGTIPAKKDVLSGVEAQLSIAALMISSCKFSDKLPQIDVSQIKALKYWKVSNSQKNNIKTMVDDGDMMDVIAATRIGLESIFDHFFIKKNEFIMNDRNNLGCYWHLSRLKS